ncbi:Lrp/AsnC family transcriptional regulator [Sphingomonas jatrophae]|uniref:Lrp/AsnC family transcriptional regulator, regulator for asnA, asnC and gidA n=1 Tax=Sphingomonas jatrophae TaxID=1166337 RepID=A0A1I6KBE4_9SPHN|nr:Lrp/AsnC family transcriptional regulator [Sphingomonas jatrophae]SFR88572.1 Lrp/AsnC family transcriptional regulator, regulator for asnA, asnC and gidA [Sphingomonas jatrophae]
MNGLQIDATDRQILDLLGEDARLSNRSLARALGLAEGTIRARIRRLTERGLLRFTAITDNRQHGSPLLGFIRIQAEMRMVRDVGAQIVDIPEIRSLIVMLGRYNLLAIGLFADQQQFTDIAAGQIAVMPGILSFQTSIVTQSLKYNERMAKLGR